MKRVQIYLDGGLLDMLDYEVKETGASRSTLIRKRLQGSFENDPQFVNFVNNKLETAYIEDNKE